MVGNKTPTIFFYYLFIFLLKIVFFISMQIFINKKEI